MRERLKTKLNPVKPEYRMNDVVSIQNQFGEHLFNFIQSKVDSQEDAQDIYQEVIIKLLNKSNQLSDVQSLKSWLFTIAKNQIIDYYRKQKRGTDIEPLLTVLESQNDFTNYHEMEGCLPGFIDQLPDDYRTVVTQSEIQGRSQKELSESLGVNYVTLRSKVQRGREKIKKMILNTCAVELDMRGRLVDCSPKNDQTPHVSGERQCGYSR